MVAVKYLLVVLEVCALFQAAYSERHCTSKISGEDTDYSVRLPTTILRAGMPAFYVEIPNVCNQVGVRVTVCNFHSTEIISMRLAIVTRSGSLSRDGSVTVTVYCPNAWLDSGSNGEAAPTLSIKEIPVSPSRTLDAQDLARSSNALVTPLDKARFQNRYGIYSSIQVTPVDEARQAADIVRETLATNTQMAVLEQARNQALSEELRNAHIVVARQIADLVREAKEAKTRQAALDQTHCQARYRIYRSAQDTQATDARHAADIVREAIQVNARQAALGQARRQARLDAYRSTQAVQAADARQAAETLQKAIVNSNKVALDHQAMDAIVSQARQAALDQAHIWAPQGIHRALALDKPGNQALNGALHTAQALDALKGANVQALETNTRQSALEQARNQGLSEALRFGQTVDARQAAHVLREAIVASARQTAALDQARRQALRLTGPTSKIGLDVDFRQAADVVLEAIGANAHRVPLIQANEAYEAQRLAQADQTADDRQAANGQQNDIESLLAKETSRINQHIQSIVRPNWCIRC